MDVVEYVVTGVLGGVVAVTSYLLQKKDAQQAEFIRDLYDKCEADSKALIQLELQIARDHPNRAAIKEMFTEFRQHMDERLDRIEQAVGVERRKPK